MLTTWRRRSVAATKSMVMVHQTIDERLELIAPAGLVLKNSGGEARDGSRMLGAMGNSVFDR
jgi:hypothetical protein